MSRKEKRPEETAAEEQKAPETEEPVQTEQAPESGEGEIDPLLAELEALKDQAAHQEDKYLRLAAEYDNYRSAHHQGKGVHLERCQGGRCFGLPSGV